MDFRNITRLFADPDWDGPIEMDDQYGMVPPKPYPNPNNLAGNMAAGVNSSPQSKPFVDKYGCEVYIINKTVSVYDIDGKLLRVESITDYTKKNIKDTYANLDDFIQHWNAAEKKAEISDLLRESGIDLQALKEDQNLEDVDDFDFICHIAYGKKPLTRRERAENVKKRDIFNKYGEDARKVLEALLDKYADDGISQLESKATLTLDPFRQMGAPAKIAKFFGGNTEYQEAVKELEELIYSIA